MEADELIGLFTELEASAGIERESDVLLALPIPGYPDHRLARDAHGQPCLLIAINAVGGERPSYGVRLEHLSVEHDVTCRLIAPGGAVDQRVFTVIRCFRGDSALWDYFLRIASVFVPAIGQHPTRHTVNQSLEELVELFRALTQPARKSVQGLWAELFVIARCRDPVLLVQAWHVTPEDLFDFSAHSARLEVKSNSSRVRQHHFALAQLQPPAGVTIAIVSLFVEQSGMGTSLADLLDMVRNRLPDRPDLTLRAESVVAASLGAALPAALVQQFAEEVSYDSLAFYDAIHVPGAAMQPPSDVRDVRFLANLAHCRCLTTDELNSAPALIGAAMQYGRR